MKVSIIIPTLNEAANIERAIQSGWEAGGSEIVVTDGQSEDATAAIASKLKCEFVSGARGRGIQLNSGAARATGDVLLFLHADNRLEPGSIEQMKRQFNREHAFGAFEQHIENEANIYRWLEWGNRLRVKWRRMPYGDQGIFVWKEVFESVGGFPDVPLMEEVALCDKLKKISRPVLLKGPIRVDSRRWEENGVLKQTVRNWILFAKYRLGARPEDLAKKY